MLRVTAARSSRSTKPVRTVEENPREIMPVCMAWESATFCMKRVGYDTEITWSIKGDNCKPAGLCN